LQGRPFKLKIKQGRQDSLSVQIVGAYSRPRIKVKDRAHGLGDNQSFIQVLIYRNESQRGMKDLAEGCEKETTAARGQRYKGVEAPITYFTLISRR
jgi:hypothetical protein